MRIGISLPVRELGNELGAIRAFAQTADELGYTHLRVPDLVLRPGGGALHEPMMLLAYVAAITEKIELVPSVIVAPSRQTALLERPGATRPASAWKRAWPWWGRASRNGVAGSGVGATPA